MKKSIRLPIIWIIIFILIGASASFTLGASSMTAEQYYKNSTPIPEILENNIKKMKKANSYGPDFVIDYITTSGKEADVVSTLAEIQTLSDTLSQGLTDDYDKINAFADYVSENIYYDFDAAHNSVTFDVICLQNVLERKRTTCAGYSNLFSALCNAQGIYCVNIRGASPGDGITRKTLDSESAATNHEWTAAYYEKESRWVYVDNTWNSNNSYKNGKFNYYAGTTRFFDISLELLSIEHKARIVDYRNFFEALTLYEEETKPNPQTKVPNTEKPTESTNKPDNSS
ncbi:MAG TPA: transglutaminase domain-containing protein, partial [Clostridiales bacterium]|nr:transglutaminase domain-containing protein [Clostridiales bacterium]